MLAAVADMTEEGTEQHSDIIADVTEHAVSEEILDGIFSDEEMEYWRQLRNRNR